MIMPPSAAMPGSTMREAPRNWPSSTSRLISRPTSRKNTAIRPSLIQCSTDSFEDDGAQAEAELGAQRVEVGWRDPAVGDEQRQQGGEHQDVAAEGFGFQERLQERGGPRAGGADGSRGPLLPSVSTRRTATARGGGSMPWFGLRMACRADPPPGRTAAGRRRDPWQSLLGAAGAGNANARGLAGRREASGAGRTGCARSLVAGARNPNST